MWQKFICEIIAILIFLILVWFYTKSVSKNLPSGPKGLPLIGYIPFLGKNPHITLAELKQKYGDIFVIYFGSYRTVILSSYKLVHEAFVKKESIFSERPAYVRAMIKFESEEGIASSYGAERVEMRRFTLTTLRDFGMGKTTSEPQILDEIDYIIEEINNLKGNPAFLRDLLSKSVVNVICMITIGKRMEYEDENFQELLHLARKVASAVGINHWTQFLPRFIKALFRLDIAAYNGSKIYQKICEEVQKYKNNDVHSRESFIDVWRIEANKSNSNSNIFNDRKLIHILTELFIAGSDTSSTSIEWYLLYFIKYPKIQERVQMEIDNVIGRNRTPSMNDQKLMPYTQATLMELNRVTTIGPLLAIHSTSEDTTLNGYFIPKDTIVLPNLWAISYDAEIFPEPGKFKPERFLTGDNQVKKQQELIPFSLGKRQCPGESLARMELFLFITSLLQHFTFTMDGEVSLDCHFGGILEPPLQKIRANQR